MVMQMVSDARKDTLIFTYKLFSFFKLLNTHPPVYYYYYGNIIIIIIIIIIVHHPAQEH